MLSVRVWGDISGRGREKADLVRVFRGFSGRGGREAALVRVKGDISGREGRCKAGRGGKGREDTEWELWCPGGGETAERTRNGSCGARVGEEKGDGRAEKREKMAMFVKNID